MTLIRRQWYVSRWNVRLPLFILAEITASPGGEKKTFLENDTDPIATLHRYELWVLILLCSYIFCSNDWNTLNLKAGDFPLEFWDMETLSIVIVSHMFTVHARFPASGENTNTKITEYLNRGTQDHQQLHTQSQHCQNEKEPAGTQSPETLPSTPGLFPPVQTVPWAALYLSSSLRPLLSWSPSTRNSSTGLSGLLTSPISKPNALYSSLPMVTS